MRTILHKKKLLFDILFPVVDKGFKISIGIVIIGLIAKHLGPSDYGKYVYYYSIIGLLGPISSLGIESYTVKFLVEKKSPLSIPPSFEELPVPSNEKVNKENQINNIESLITEESNNEKLETVESDKDFEDTMKFVNEINYVIAYSFMYSKRPGTPAQKKDNIPLAEKKARLSALQSLLKEQQKNYNKSFVGRKLEVLFEKKGRHKDQFIGRSIYNQSVFTNSKFDLINKIENVEIINSTDFALESSV